MKDYQQYHMPIHSKMNMKIQQLIIVEISTYYLKRLFLFLIK